jgi:hypothetical protein
MNMSDRSANKKTKGEGGERLKVKHWRRRNKIDGWRYPERH